MLSQKPPLLAQHSPRQQIYSRSSRANEDGDGVSNNLARLPPLEKCSSCRSYVGERIQLLRNSDKLREMFQVDLLSRSPRVAKTNRCVSETQAEEELPAVNQRQRDCFIQLHYEQRKKVLDELAKSQEKCERAERAREFLKNAQALVRQWSGIVIFTTVGNCVRKCLLLGYRDKWKKILIVLVARRWLLRTRRRCRRFEYLRFNLILRKALPQVIDRVRSKRQAEHIVVIKSFLKVCGAATSIVRVLHKFLTSVRRIQRFVRRRQCATKLIVAALKINFDKAFSLVLEEKFFETPSAFRRKICERLATIDRETTLFEKSQTLDRLLSDADVIDKAETTKYDGFVHAQSILIQSCLITMIRCRGIVKHTSLPQVLLSYERGRTLSADEKERLKRWFLELFLRFQLDDVAPAVEEIEINNVVGAASRNSHSSIADLVRREESTVCLDTLLHHRHRQLQRLALDRTLVHNPTSSLATSRAGSLTAMANACSNVTLPFFVANDLVMMVLNQLPRHPRSKRKGLLKPSAMNTLVRVSREAWNGAVRKLFSPQTHEFPVCSDVQKVHDKKTPISVEEKVTRNVAMIEQMAASYAPRPLAASDIDEVLRTIDFSFVDSFYRRVR